MRFGINAKTNEEGDLACVQGKDFSTTFSLIHENVFNVRSTEIKDRDILSVGEVLFAAKGARNYAVVWNSQIKIACATSTFIILSTKDNHVLPEYLSWYLNSKRAYKYFIPFKKKGTIPVINKKALEDFEITVPAIEKQKLIVNAFWSWKKEKNIANTLLEKKEQLMQQTIENYLNNI